MKKRILAVIAALACITAAGCADKTVTTDNSKGASVSESSSAGGGGQSSEEKDSSKAEESSEEDNESLEESSEESPAVETAENGDDIDEVNEENDGSSEKEIAEKLYEQACQMTWDYILSSPYELDFDDADGNAYMVIGVSSVDEIKAEYGKVFLDTSPVDDKYYEKDGKVYCYDGARGSDITYKATDLIPVSSDGSRALYTAVSHYADPQTNEPMDNMSHDFSIVIDNGTWRVDEFTLPN